MRSIVEAIPHMVWVAAPDGANLYNSPSLLAFTGLTDADVARDGWGRTIHPADLEGALAFWNDLVRTGQPGTRVHRVRRHDGEYRFCRVMAAPLRGPDGRVVRWIGTWTDVHDATLVEAALRDSEAKLRLAKDAAHMGAWEWDLSTGVRSFSARCRPLLGLPPGGELAEAEVLTAIHPDDRTRVPAALERAVKEDAPVQVEVRVPLPGGELRAVELRGRAFFDARGAPLRVAGMALDVTQRRQIEDALRASERDARRRTAELEAVLDAVPAAVFLTRDPEARHIEANAAGRELLGIPPGANASLAAPPGERRRYVPLKDGAPLTLDQMPMQAAARFGELVSGFEYDIVREDGEVRHVVANSRPIVDAAGERQGAVGALVDVTAERRTLAALAESEARFRQLADAMPQLVWTAGPDGQVDWYNSRYREFAGITRDPAGQAWSWAPVLHPDDLAATQAAWGHALRSGATYEIAHRVRRADGTFRWYLSRGVPVHGAGGAVVRWYGTATDIDDQKRAADELRLSDQRKSDFLAILSHELRNPLAPIRNAIYLLDRAQPGSPQAIRAKEVIRRQSDHLAKLVDDLLDLSRIDHGKITLDRTLVDAREVVRRAVEDARPSFEARDIALGIETPADPTLVDADPVRLAQIAGNLLGNAVKFTAPGGAVEVALRTRDAVLELSVRDDGVGIEPAQLERVFEPFAQAERARTTGQGGLGIGLALVRSLAALHGGAAVARSEGLGRGTEVLVTLPLASARPAAAAVDRPRPPPALSILIVEDNADAGETLAELLRLQGHQARLAPSGGAALAAFGIARPDVLISDIGLPDMDGYEVVRRMRALAGGRDTYAVALTGFAQPEDVRRAQEAGFDAHLPKPPPLEDLERLLAAAARAR